MSGVELALTAGAASDADKPAEQPPVDAVLHEHVRQDEAMSVTTVPDEAVKMEESEAGAAEAAGTNGLPSQNLGGEPQAPAVPRGVVILTAEQAKQQKLQKGYSLEPLLVDPAAEAPPALISGKRERKKSNHFGNIDMVYIILICVVWVLFCCAR